MLTPGSGTALAMRIRIHNEENQPICGITLWQKCGNTFKNVKYIVF
jgi:hypothetical protein